MKAYYEELHDFTRFWEGMSSTWWRAGISSADLQEERLKASLLLLRPMLQNLLNSYLGRLRHPRCIPLNKQAGSIPSSYINTQPLKSVFNYQIDLHRMGPWSDLDFPLSDFQCGAAVI